MIKLIASDLDGTLLQNGAQELNPEIYDLILALKERGIHFAAASGRQYASERNLFKPIADEIQDSSNGERNILRNSSCSSDNGFTILGRYLSLSSECRRTGNPVPTGGSE